MNILYNKGMFNEQRSGVIIAVLSGIIVILLVVVGMLVFNNKQIDTNVLPEVLDDDTDVLNTETATTSSIIENSTTTLYTQDLVQGKYVPLSACIDYDTRTPFYTRTFLAGYTHTDGSPVSDACIDIGPTNNLLLEFSCKGDELVSEEFECPFGCFNGACVLEGQAEIYEKQQGSKMFTWYEDSVEISLANAYIGKTIAPYGTQNNEGGVYGVGETVYALTLSLSVKTGETDACIPNNVKRVLDESGATIAPNTEDLQFIYSGGCFVPAQTEAFVDIVFIVDPTETVFTIKTGGTDNKTFIIEKTNDGAVVVDNTLEVG